MVELQTTEAHKTNAFFALVNNRFKFTLFLLKSLPAAYFSGVKILTANEQSCSVSVPSKWFTRNPFRSTYFASLSMAAEMSTGVLAMAHVYKRKPAVSMLIIEMESRYHKKATGVTIFKCEDGLQLKQAIQLAIDTNQPQTMTVKSAGYNQQNELMAEFWFKWSFRLKHQ